MTSTQPSQLHQHETGGFDMQPAFQFACVVALCGAVDLANAETRSFTFNTDDGGTFTLTTHGDQGPIPFSANKNKAWKSFALRYPDGQIVCKAFTQDTNRSNITLHINLEPRNSLKVVVETSFNISADHVALKIGRQSFHLPAQHLFGGDPRHAWVSTETYPEKTRKIIDAVRRGSRAHLTAKSPSGYDITVPFSLMGATAMTNHAATNCGMLAAVQPPRRAQPTRQAQTTSQQRQHQMQTTTHQPREEDFITDLGGQLGNQLMDQATQMLADEITNQMFGDFGF